MKKEVLFKKALTICLKTDAKILKELEKEWDEFNKMLTELKAIDVSGVEPMTRIDQTPIGFWHQDEPKNMLASETFFDNAAEAKNEYVVVKRTVKDD